MFFRLFSQPEVRIQSPRVLYFMGVGAVSSGSSDGINGLGKS